MADDKSRPRARGRAKGRARPPAVQIRPGEEPQPVTASTAGAVAAGAVAAGAVASSHPPMGSGGRQTHRGVSRAEAVSRPGEQTAEVTQQMAAVSLQPRQSTARVGRGGPVEELYTRPPVAVLAKKQGTEGRKINLLTNYFLLVQRPSWCVYQYHVDFAPTIESSRMRRALLGDHRNVLGNCYLFDGMSDLKTVQKLEQMVTTLFSIRKSDGENIRITIRHTNELAPNNPQLGHLFNTQMRRNLSHLEFYLIGRHYFDKKAVTELKQLKLDVWPGIVTSIRMQEEQLMMMVDTIHKVVRTETVLDVLTELARRYQTRDFQDAAVKELVGSIVMTRYNTRTYRVEDICWEEKPIDQFETKGNEKISYVDYYKRHYEIQIRDVKQPLLLCTAKEREIRGGQSQAKRIMLIPELCVITGLDERMRANFTLMKELATVTKLEPQHRVENLKTFIKRVNANPDVRREMQAWDLKFSEDLVQIESRILPPEEIVQAGQSYHYDPKTADFSKEMRGRQMHVPRALRSWIVISTKRDKMACNDFLQMLERVCAPMGMNWTPPRVIHIDDDRIGTYNKTFTENYRRDLEMVVFIVPNNKKDRYDALKKQTCLEHPVPSQVIVTRTINKKTMLMSVCTKIGIQLNCKLGGEPWSLKIPLTTPAMIIGYDTYHDSSRKGRSAGGFVASMNSLFTKWYSKVNFHEAGGWQELSNHLRTNLTEALRKFSDENGRVPEIIIFYRDGVGDGQISYVLDWEVKQLERCICEVLEGKKYTPDAVLKTRYAFFIVNKRISTRFFALDAQKRVSNPPPGTCVDDTVTRFDRYDFYLVSQNVRQGTVAPTMYNIIKDRSGFRPTHMQRLSYKLTHLYFNWPGTIRVPAPCQYAHKLAFLAGQSLHREPSDALAMKLYYL